MVIFCINTQRLDRLHHRNVRSADNIAVVGEVWRKTRIYRFLDVLNIWTCLTVKKEFSPIIFEKKLIEDYDLENMQFQHNAATNHTTQTNRAQIFPNTFGFFPMELCYLFFGLDKGFRHVQCAIDIQKKFRQGCLLSPLLFNQNRTDSQRGIRGNQSEW